MTQPSVELSVEYFPPQTPEGLEKLRVVRQKLDALEPTFCSVTYGAGGSTRERTFAVIREMVDEGIDAAPHLSCIGSTRDSIQEADRRARNDHVALERNSVTIGLSAARRRDIAEQLNRAARVGRYRCRCNAAPKFFPYGFYTATSFIHVLNVVMNKRGVMKQF
jgi:hypothetical protein